MPLSTKDFILLLLSSVLVSSDSTSSRKKLRTNKNEEEAVGVNEDETAVTEGAGEENGKPLEHKWTIWYEDKSQHERKGTINKNDYLNHINKAGTFETIEGFWNCWNEVQELFPSNGDCNYLLFQQGIKPVWEDPKNSKGGKCFVVLPRTSHEDMVKQWVTLLLTVFIQEFDAEINGAVLSSRSWGNMFAVWTRVSDKHVVDSVCNKLQEIFGNNVQVKFQKHQIMMRKTNNKSRGGKTSPEHHSDEEEKKVRHHQQQPRRRSVVTTETKGVLHNLIAEMREAQPEYSEAEPAKDVSHMPKETETSPGSAGQAAVAHPTKEKKRRRSIDNKKTERIVELQKGWSTLEKIGLGVLLLAGGVATSALSWIYL